MRGLTASRSTAKTLAAAMPLALLAGCSSDYRLFHPASPVAQAQWRFTIIDVAVMMILILPVTVAIALFVWRYNKKRNAHYDPSWSHSLGLEFVMWGAPIVIVIILGYYSFQSVFLVNPANPTSLDSPAGAAPAAAPLQVDVITTDWQWLFIYPTLHIATIDDLVVPAGTNVQLRLTSASVTNDFFIPQVASMIDVMPGMRTKDAFRVDKPGNFEGFSADFSGDGFSWMQFSTRIVSAADFASFVAMAQASPHQLSYTQFQQLAQPTVNVGAKTKYFSDVEPQLFEKVYDAAQQGVVYPVPTDLTTKAPNASPTLGKQGEAKKTNS